VKLTIKQMFSVELWKLVTKKFVCEKTSIFLCKKRVAFCCVAKQTYGKHILPVLKNVYFTLGEIDKICGVELKKCFV
jgi:hypothetical protein